MTKFMRTISVIILYITLLIFFYTIFISIDEIKLKNHVSNTNCTIIIEIIISFWIGFYKKKIEWFFLPIISILLIWGEIDITIVIISTYSGWFYGKHGASL